MRRKLLRPLMMRSCNKMSEDFLSRADMLLDATDLSGLDRAALHLRILTDHLCARTDHEPDALARITAAFQDALGAAGLDALASVAARLVAHPQSDDAILTGLAMRCSEPAIAAIRAGRVHDLSLLRHLAERGGSACAAAIAARGDLAPEVAAVLFRRPEPEVLVALVTNARFHLDRATATWLVSRARHDRPLAQALLARSPLACDLTPLFLFADTQKRSTMIVEARRRDLGLVPEFRPALPQDVIAGISTSTSQREIDALVVVLALRLGIPRTMMTRFIEDEGGEPLALACNVAGMAPDQVLELFCRLRGRRRDDPDVVSLTRLAVDLAPQTARRILTAIVGRMSGVQIAESAARGDRTPYRRDAVETGASAGGKTAPLRTASGPGTGIVR